MNSVVRTILFWVLLTVLAVVLWKMAPRRGEAGTVVVGSVPNSADIYVDGKFLGDAPASLTLAPGKHAIRLSLNGYKDWTRDVSVLASSKVSLNAALEKN
jgi:hypothetical protein